MWGVLGQQASVDGCADQCFCGLGWGGGEVGGWGRGIKLMWIVAYHGGRVGWGSKLS